MELQKKGGLAPLSMAPSSDNVEKSIAKDYSQLI